MANTWRQGDLIAPDDAVRLGIFENAQRESNRALVISHCCDLAASESVEPTIELLLGQVIAEDQATCRNGHSIRRLDLEGMVAVGTEFARFDVNSRRTVAKLELLHYRPWDEVSYPTLQRSLLRRWLGQRYSRSQFPDAFNAWFKDSGVNEGFEKLGKRDSVILVGVFFDLDDDTERTNPDEPYALGINLVYDTADANNRDRAEKACERLDDLFAKKCKATGRWRWLELFYCEAIADDKFSLRAAREFRRWRFEHRSLEGQPMDTSE